MKDLIESYREMFKLLKLDLPNGSNLWLVDLEKLHAKIHIRLSHNFNL